MEETENAIPDGWNDVHAEVSQLWCNGVMIGSVAFMGPNAGFFADANYQVSDLETPILANTSTPSREAGRTWVEQVTGYADLAS